MHWKGLRLVADGKKQAVEPQGQSRRSEHLPRPYPPATEPRLSESIPRISRLSSSHAHLPGLQVPDDKGPDDVPQPDFAGSSSGNTPSLRRNRFSFMRLRHASDPQLSKSYVKAGEQDAPPVPSLPRK
jgi:hypothetical protein